MIRHTWTHTGEKSYKCDIYHSLKATNWHLTCKHAQVKSCININSVSNHSLITFIRKIIYEKLIHKSQIVFLLTIFHFWWNTHDTICGQISCDIYPESCYYYSHFLGRIFQYKYNKCWKPMNPIEILCIVLYIIYY